MSINVLMVIVELPGGIWSSPRPELDTMWTNMTLYHTSSLESTSTEQEV